MANSQIKLGDRPIYTLTGHGECSIDNTDRHIGCSLMRDALSLESFLVAKLSLVGGAEIPADADVLVIPGPKSDFLEVETATLAGWVVEDVEELVDELTAKGLTFEQYDEESLKTNEKGIIEGDGVKVAFLRDPDGNTHAFNQS